MAKASNNEFPSVLFTDGTADPSSPSASTVRLYFKDDAPYWINSGGTATAFTTGTFATALSELDDVGTATPGDGEVLAYSTANSQWEPSAAAGGPGTADYVHADDGGKEELSTNATSGAAATADLADGNVHDITLTANCTLTFAGATSGVGCSFTLIARQDGTGSRTITWPASVDWSGGSAPTLSTAASAVDVFTFLTVDGGTTWLGFTAGTAMA